MRDHCEQDNYQSDTDLLRVESNKYSQIKDYLVYSKGGCIIRPIDSYDSVATNHVLKFHAQKNSAQSRVCIYFENSPKSSLIPLAEAHSGFVKFRTIIANVSDFYAENVSE